MGNNTSSPRVCKWGDLDSVYYINLAHRVDREEAFQKELQKMLVDPEKIHKLYASTGCAGFMGCTKSHIRILQMALASGAKMVAVFEDDFMLTMKISKAEYIVNEFWKTFPTANVLMLQSNPIDVEPTSLYGVSKVNKALSTAGYLIKSDYIPTMLDNLQQSLKLGKPFDLGLYKLQGRDNWYALQPPMGKQRPSFSDIEQRYVNYGV